MFCSYKATNTKTNAVFNPIIDIIRKNFMKMRKQYGFPSINQIVFI